VDLLLIHWPGPYRGHDFPESSDKECNSNDEMYNIKLCRLQTWKALEHIFKSNKAKAIGVSNYTIDQLEELIQLNGILPAVNQVP